MEKEFLKKYFKKADKVIPSPDHFIKYSLLTYEILGIAATKDELHPPGTGMVTYEVSQASNLKVEYLFHWKGKMYLTVPSHHFELCITEIDFKNKITTLDLIPSSVKKMSSLKLLSPYKSKIYTSFTNRIAFSGLGYCCLINISEEVKIPEEYIIDDTVVIDFSLQEFLTPTTADSIIKEVKGYLYKSIHNDIDFIKSNYGYPYSISEMSGSLKGLYKSSVKTEASPRHEKLASFLPFSFGVELETQSGLVPLRTLFKNDFVFLRDGSIKGLEYTSLPLKGATGLAKLEDFCSKLNKVATIDELCSLHIHLGETNLNEEQIVALYKTIYQTQQELFDFVPNYKRAAKYFAKKQDYKDHCKPLKSLGIYNTSDVHEMYAAIIDFVTNKGNDEMLGAQKWNQFPRYHHLNLLNLFSKGGSGTIEFRLHEPTTNYQKVLLWLFIITGLTQYAKKYSSKIVKDEIKIVLKDVIKDIYPSSISSFINEYIKDRTLNYTSTYIDDHVEDYSSLKEDKKVFKQKEFEQLFLSDVPIEELEMI
jgi:hypothetical protein